MRLLGTALVVGLICGGAHAADKDGNFQILGAGALKCQKLLDADKQDRLYVETWWAGYVTGVNQTTDDTWRSVGKKSVDDVNDLTQKQCTAHPDDLIGIAVHDVLEDIYTTRTKADPNK